MSAPGRSALGAGVIFKGRDVVRGLTTAATIWVSAAVGMACGAGMVSLAVVLTIFHLVTLFVIAPAVRKIPTVDRNRVMHIDYADGQGVLRQILEIATTMGFSSSILRTRRTGDQQDPCVQRPPPSSELGCYFTGRSSSETSIRFTSWYSLVCI